MFKSFLIAINLRKKILDFIACRSSKSYAFLVLSCQKIFFKVFVACAVFLSTAVLEPCLAKAKSSVPDSYSVTIVAMGDSLTAGYGLDPSQAYPAFLEKKLHRTGYRVRVINAGISGETSSGALSRVNWVLKLDPKIVVLETGANDGLRGIDPGLLKKNLMRIIQRFQKHNVCVILAGMKMVTSLGEQYTRDFERVYTEVAEETSVILIPFFLEGIAQKPSLTLYDGIHPNESGYRIIADRVFTYVVEAINKKIKADDAGNIGKDTDEK
jgi:acyl-CoA thioesterase-1